MLIVARDGHAECLELLVWGDEQIWISKSSLRKRRSRMDVGRGKNE